MKGVAQIDERNIYGYIEKGKITRFIKKKKILKTSHTRKGILTEFHDIKQLFLKKKTSIVHWQ